MSQEPDLYIPDERDAFDLNASCFPYGIFPVFPTRGLLYEEDGEWIASDKDFLSTFVLPSFIKDRESALAFLHHSYLQFRMGVDLGASAKERDFSSQVVKALGLASQETVERLQRDIDKLQKRLSS